MSPAACDVAVTVLELTEIVLDSRVSAVSLATKVLVPVGRVITPPLEMVEITGNVKVLLERVSVVSLPTRVLLPVGTVTVPELDIEDIMGSVNVLLDRVSCLALPENKDQTPPVNL